MPKIFTSTMVQTVALAFIAAFFAALPPTIIAWNTNNKLDDTNAKVEEVHKATNGLTEKLGNALTEAALVKGHTEGVKDEKTSKALNDALVEKSRAEGVEAEAARAGKVKSQDMKAVDPKSEKRK